MRCVSLRGLRPVPGRCSRFFPRATISSFRTASTGRHEFLPGLLKRFGVATTFYDPLVGAGIER